MPTKHRRIAVTEDEELAEALRRVTLLFENGKPASSLVRDLAIIGAERMLKDDERARAARRRLAEWSINMSEEERELLREARRSSVGGETEEW
ncbi:MAG: hypothetical protein ACR2LY_08225 [Thermoleophilaceae bacterium]